MYGYGVSEQGGAVMAPAVVSGGEVKRVIISP